MAFYNMRRIKRIGLKSHRRVVRIYLSIVDSFHTDDTEDYGKGDHVINLYLEMRVQMVL